jgi:imidazolonepropionase-like amidohydrolase
MLTNTITGKIWKDHLAARSRADSAAAKARADTTAEGRRERTSAELRRKEDDAGKGLEMRRRNAQKLIRGGCIPTVGTDNYLGQAPEFRRTPKADNQNMGIGTIIGIEGLVELGMTPAEAIVAATKNGAIASRGLEKFGTLEAGKLADVVMLDADPLADISNIRKLAVVMKEGAIVDLNALPTKPVWHKR